MVVAAGTAIAVTQVGGIPPASSAHAQASPNYTWPRMGYSPGNSDVSPDPGITGANASQLGLKWMAPNGSAVMSSPVSGFSPELGKDLVFQGTETGSLNAFDAATGRQLWSDSLGSAIRDTPLVEGKYLWVSPTYSPAMYKIDTATGMIMCSARMISTNNASATIGTPPGGKLSIYTAELDYGVSNGPVYSIDEATCAINWTFTAFPTPPQFPLGAWDPLAYGTDASGRALLIFGSSDPGQIDALNASTGKLAWHFTTSPAQPGGHANDVGAGVTISPPGVNGFADGMVYVAEEGGYYYAADLTTGQVVWTSHFAKNFNLPKPFSRSTGAVVGDQVIFGTSTGVVALNASNGQTAWSWTDDVGGNPESEVVGAVAVVGPPNGRVVAVDDLAGGFNVLNASTGALLYHYQLGGFAVQSVSDVNGNLVTAASNGYDYDFAIGGANQGGPSTGVSSPTPGSVLVNSGGPVTISGTASGGPIRSVNVAIQSGGPSGPWWNSVTQSWTTGFFANHAMLSSPGTAATNWSLQMPVPSAGGVFEVFASANGSDGIADTSAFSSTPGTAQVSFTVKHQTGAPFVTTTQGRYVAPGDPIEVGGAGFAPNEKIAISMGGVTLTTVQAGSSGGFASAMVPVPADSPFGPNELVALGQQSASQAVTPIDVSNTWTMQGGGSQEQAFESNDPAFQRHISPSLEQFLSQAWMYSSGAKIEGSPVVQKGVAYFANDAGTVGAINVHTGAPLWAFSAGSKVDSTPALGGGLVVFGQTAQSGSSTGQLVALSMTTGSPSWSMTTTSPIESSPQIANGIAYVGSDDGTVYAVHLLTGSVLWTYQAPGAVTDSPAVDPTQHVVVFADSTGRITALNSATGAFLWSHATGGPVTASPSVFSGYVLVGSADGIVYALGETSGSVNWTYSAGSPITGSGCLYTGGPKAQNEYVFGTSNGAMDYLNLSTGTLNHNFQTTGAIVAVSCATSWAVFNTAGGQAIGIKYPSQYSWVYTAPAGFASGAAVSDGVVYLTGLDKTVVAFTIPGQQIP